MQSQRVSRTLRQPWVRSATIVASIISISAIAGCSAEVPEEIRESTPPTMAPPQNVTEACAISSEAISAATAAITADVESVIEEAGAELAAGRLPDLTQLQSLSLEFGDTLEVLRSDVTNDELGTYLDDIQHSVAEIGALDGPQNPFEVPGYLASLTTQVNALIENTSEIQLLCTGSTNEENPPAE